jgi:hypothetical protein
MELYHVDTAQSITPGVELPLNVNPTQDVSPELITAIEEIFEDGLTPYGQIIAYGSVNSETQTRINEFVFELYRQVHYPELPSRFQSMFAVDSLENAWSYNQDEIESEGPSDVYKIEVDEFSGPHYMGHLATPSLAVGLFNANLYWKGIEHTNSMPEYMFNLPVVFDEPVCTLDG